MIDVRLVERRAQASNISLRTGCFCNPGAGEAAFGIPRQALVESFRAGVEMPFEQLMAALGVEGGGAVRISVGLVSTFADAHALVEFARSFLDAVPDERHLPPRQHC